MAEQAEEVEYNNPALVSCFEEAESIFNLTSSLDISSRLDISTKFVSESQEVDSECSSDDNSSDSDGIEDQGDIEETMPVPMPVVPMRNVSADNDEEFFFREGCCCKLGQQNSPCSQALSREIVMNYQYQCLELSKDELDMVVLGQLAAVRRRHSTIAVVSDQSRKKRRVTSRPYTAFRFGDMLVCKETFLFLHAITKKRFKNLCHHFDSCGLMPRTHGNTKRVPHNAFPLSVTKQVVDFIVNYAETHALPLPGRLPSHRDFQVMLLPTETTKSKVYKEYEKACAASSVSCCSKPHFYFLWRKQVPYIRVMKPYTDLCDTCQQMMGSVSSIANLPDEEKASKLQEFGQHLDLAKSERIFYNQQCKECHDKLPKVASTPVEVMHYSFDFAQQIHFPSSPQQPGSLYFKTARKCAVFGICCEPLSKQVTYIIDEACMTGKGADSVISYVHHFLEVHSEKETKLLLHADNCCGQNKNNALMHYLAWRTLTTRHTSIQISFMIPGHTKFAPDRFFGLFKKRFRTSNVETLQDVAHAVSTCTSTDKAKNLPQPVVDLTSKQQVVHTYRWSSFLDQYFKPIPHILSYQVFRVSASKPGVFSLQKHSSSSIEEVSTLRDPDTVIPLQSIPEEIPLKGLTADRQWYLYEHIREFCTTEEAANLTCPKPTISKQNQQIAPVEANKDTTRVRLCSVCCCPGHNKRSCPKK